MTQKYSIFLFSQEAKPIPQSELEPIAGAFVLVNKYISDVLDLTLPWQKQFFFVIINYIPGMEQWEYYGRNQEMFSWESFSEHYWGTIMCQAWC